MNIVGVQEVSEDKLEDSCDLCEYKDDARGMMKTHNTSFHKYMLCTCNHCDYETDKLGQSSAKLIANLVKFLLKNLNCCLSCFQVVAWPELELFWVVLG